MVDQLYVKNLNGFLMCQGKPADKGLPSRSVYLCPRSLGLHTNRWQLSDGKELSSALFSGAPLPGCMT